MAWINGVGSLVGIYGVVMSCVLLPVGSAHLGLRRGGIAVAKCMGRYLLLDPRLLERLLQPTAHIRRSDLVATFNPARPWVLGLRP